MLFARVNLGMESTSYGKERYAYFFYVNFQNMTVLGSNVQCSGFQAEVFGTFSVNDENRPEFQLKKYDYFGYGNDIHPVLYCLEVFSFHTIRHGLIR